MSGLSEMRLEKLVRTLLRATENDQIKWESVLPETQRGDMTKRTIRCFVGDFEGQRFRLSEFNEKHFTDEDSYEWLTAISLAFIDRNGLPLFELPRMVGIPELMEAVKYQAAGVERFLDKIGV